MASNFLIIGNGGSGTSLLRGFLNSHSKVECCFEHWGDWQDQASKCKYEVWGNKQPLERFWSYKWEDSQIVDLIDDYLIIWIVRRYDKWLKKQVSRKAEANWQRGRGIYWAIRNRKPDRVIEVAFEDLLLRPEAELRRVCDFLHVGYEQRMLRDGVHKTGHKSFNYGRIILDKV